MLTESTRSPSQESFYEQALTRAERSQIGEALAVTGVDEEIVALRLRLRTALKEHPEDLALILRGMEVLRRLVATRYGLSREDQRALDSAFARETARRITQRGGERDDAK